MNEMQGKFFVLEGIDGSGGETQRERLAHKFREHAVPVEILKYPDYAGPIGALIHEYLYKKHNFSKDVQFLLHCADFLKDKEKILRWLGEGKTVIADRYFPSTLAFQCLHGIPVERALEIGRFLELPIPDAILLLDTSAETSMQRKTKEKHGNLDRNESNEQFLADTAGFYKQLAEKNIFAQWKVINGEQSMEQVTQAIWQIISPPLD